MNHNLYRATNYLVHHIDKKTNENLYFTGFTNKMSLEVCTANFSDCKRKKAARIIRFYHLLNHLLIFFLISTKRNDFDFWDLNIDCCFSNGAFKTVNIREIIDEIGFCRLYDYIDKNKLLPNHDKQAMFPIGEDLTFRDIRLGIFQSLLDNKVYKEYNFLMLFPSQNRSTDHHLKDCVELGIQTQRLKVRSEHYRGFLFKNPDDINFVLLSVDFGKVRKIINLLDYKELVYNSMVKDKNYNEKISSTV